MKKLLLGLTLLTSITSFASSSNCQFEAGQYTNKVSLNVVLGDNPSIEGLPASRKCESTDFTKEVANNVLEYKVSTIESFYGEEVATKARKILSEDLRLATGGTLVMCNDSPQSSVGIIVNGNNSYLVLNGGNAYFEMTKGTCN